MYGRNEIPAALLADVKNYLNITWDDLATDERIRGLIASATAELDDYGGETLDYMSDGLPRTLMMDHVRYARDEALDVFENNYRTQLVRLRNRRRVTGYVESTKQTET